MAGISIREFIRWLPAEASEPTSTMVLTSPGRRFVDIRIQLPVELGRTESTNIGMLVFQIDNQVAIILIATSRWDPARTS